MGLKHSLIGVTGFFGLVSTVLGHEGHGHPEMQSGVLHYVVNPVHFGPVLAGCAVLVAGGLLWAAARRRTEARVISRTGRK